MSIKIMSLVWELDLPSSEKFVLLAYTDHSDHEGRNIFPAVSTIMWKTGLSERTVQRATRELERKGYLVADGKGPNGTNQWRFGTGVSPRRGVKKGDKVAPKSVDEEEEIVLSSEQSPALELDEEAGKIVTLWENLHTFLNPTHANLLYDMLDSWRAHVEKLPGGHPDKKLDAVAVFEKAMKTTAKSARNPHSLAYMEQVIENWMANGYGFNPNERKEPDLADRPEYQRYEYDPEQDKKYVPPPAQRPRILQSAD